MTKKEEVDVQDAEAGIYAGVQGTGCEAGEVWPDDHTPGRSPAASGRRVGVIRQISIDSSKVMIYTSPMISSYRHKGLEELAKAGKSAKVRPDLWARAVRRLDAIAAAKTPEALRIPGFDFHPLQGNPQRYSVHVNGPWCITFGWGSENAIDVDLENYH